MKPINGDHTAGKSFQGINNHSTVFSTPFGIWEKGKEVQGLGKTEEREGGHLLKGERERNAARKGWRMRRGTEETLRDEETHTVNQSKCIHG